MALPFHLAAKNEVTHENIATLIQNLAQAGIPFSQTENLCTFDGHTGYTLAQEEQ